MPASPSPRPATGRLTFEEIVDAAAALVAEEGFEALSMRRLAARCGVGAMTLYGYVRTKEDLLGALANRFMSEIELPREDDQAWDEQVATVFRSVRRVFLEHPELLPIAATQRLEGPGVYRGAELVFAALRRAGLGDLQVVAAFDALTSFTIGAAQRETGLRTRDVESLPGIRELEAEEFANVIGLAGLLMTRDLAQSFEAGLELLLAGIASWARTTP
jgi:AcrR family transcriptional regulator